MPRKKKKKSVNPDSITKSIFFYGRPNTGKLKALRKIQQDYTDDINRFVTLINSDPNCILPVLKNDRKSSYMRALEKANRAEGRGCTYSQNAFDEALKLLHNRMTDIKTAVWLKTKSELVNSITLYDAVLRKVDRYGMKDLVSDLITYDRERMNAVRCDGKSGPQKTASAQKTLDYHQGLYDLLDDMDQEVFDRTADEIRFLTKCESDRMKLPHVEKVTVMTTSCNARMIASDTTQMPFVFSAADPANPGKRIEVPVNASRAALHRIERYGLSPSFTFTVTGNRLKVTGSFKKETKPLTGTEYLGVDTGIVDMLSISDGRAFGSFVPDETFYRDEVEPALAERSKLRNKKRKLQKYLRNHRDVPDAVRADIIRKIDCLESMLRHEKKSVRLLNRYRSEQEAHICQAVDAYIASIDPNHPPVTVIELLDTTGFNKGRNANFLLSNFARAQLQDRLKDRLSWNRLPFLEVTPDYTSQVCPVCGHREKANRNGKVFRCRCCGHTDDADHNAAVNIKARAEDERLMEICRIPVRADMQKAIIDYYKTINTEWKTRNRFVRASA